MHRSKHNTNVNNKIICFLKIQDFYYLRSWKINLVEEQDKDFKHSILTVWKNPKRLWINFLMKTVKTQTVEENNEKKLDTWKKTLTIK